MKDAVHISDVCYERCFSEFQTLAMKDAVHISDIEMKCVLRLHFGHSLAKLGQRCTASHLLVSYFDFSQKFAML
jgi:hypothetical protein